MAAVMAMTAVTGCGSKADDAKDDPRNQDDIGENEILVVSFVTSFNDIRVADNLCCEGSSD